MTLNRNRWPTWPGSRAALSVLPLFVCLAGSIAHADIRGLISQLKDPDAKVRAAAAGSLSGTKDSRAREPLIAALHDPDATVRWSTALALGRRRDHAAVDGLILLLKGQYRQVRITAAEALGNIGDARTAEPLVDSLRVGKEYSEPSGPDAFGAVRALSKLGAAAVAPCIAGLKGPAAGVRAGAAQALWWIMEPKAAPAQAAALADPDPSVRHWAAEGLLWTGDARAVEPLIGVLQDPEPSLGIGRPSPVAQSFACRWQRAGPGPPETHQATPANQQGRARAASKTSGHTH